MQEKKKAKKKKKENEFSPVCRSRGGGSEYLEPFSVVDAFTKRKGCPG